MSLAKGLLEDQRTLYMACANFNPANSKGSSFDNAEACVGVS